MDEPSTSRDGINNQYQQSTESFNSKVSKFNGRKRLKLDAHSQGTFDDESDYDSDSNSTEPFTPTLTYQQMLESSLLNEQKPKLEQHSSHFLDTTEPSTSSAFHDSNSTKSTKQLGDLTVENTTKSRKYNKTPSSQIFMPQTITDLPTSNYRQILKVNLPPFVDSEEPREFTAFSVQRTDEPSRWIRNSPEFWDFSDEPTEPVEKPSEFSPSFFASVEEFMYDEEGNSEESSSVSNLMKSLFPRKVRSYTINQKLEVVEFAKQHSTSAANKKYGIDRKCIREWRRNEDELVRLRSSSLMTPLRRRRHGAGRQVKNQIFDDDLAQWLKAELKQGRNPSRANIQWKALEMARQNGIDRFKASTGWLEKFLTRHDFRAKPMNSEEKRLSFLINKPYQPSKFDPFVEFLQKICFENGYKNIYVAYKTTILIDEKGEMTVVESQEGQEEKRDVKGEEEGKSEESNSNKTRVTIILTIRSDGKKFHPFIALPNTNINDNITDTSASATFDEQLNLTWVEPNDSDQEFVSLYLRELFGREPASRRLVVWNKFDCQLSDEFSAFLEEKELSNMLIPERFGQFKESLQTSLLDHFVAELFEQQAKFKYEGQDETADNGRLGPLSLNLFLQWVLFAWHSGVKASVVTSLFVHRDIENVMRNLGVPSLDFPDGMNGRQGRLGFPERLNGKKGKRGFPERLKGSERRNGPERRNFPKRLNNPERLNGPEKLGGPGRLSGSGQMDVYTNGLDEDDDEEVEEEDLNGEYRVEYHRFLDKILESIEEVVGDEREGTE